MQLMLVLFNWELLALYSYALAAFFIQITALDA